MFIKYINFYFFAARGMDSIEVMKVVFSGFLNVMARRETGQNNTSLSYGKLSNDLVELQ